jgi:hypothetical protein
VNGADVGAWDVQVNANFSSLDSLLGGGTSLSVTSGNYTLTQAQANSLWFNISGTLTSDVTITFPAVGGFYCFNSFCTMNGHNLTVGPAGGGFVPLQGSGSGSTPSQIFIYMDGVNAHYLNGYYPGTTLTFIQAAAPIGFVQRTDINDYTMRIVSGAGAAGHGSVGLSAFIAAGTQGHTLSAYEMPAHNHGVNDPGHAHGYQDVFAGSGGSFITVAGSGGARIATQTQGTDVAYTGISIQNAGSGGAHNHPLYDLAYVDMILCYKA